MWESTSKPVGGTDDLAHTNSKLTNIFSSKALLKWKLISFDNRTIVTD